MKFSVLNWNIQTGIWFWPCRRKNVIKAIIESNADIVCLQEVLNNQLVAITKALGDSYGSYSVPRGGLIPEACSILWKRDTILTLSHHTYWLNKNWLFPRVYSRLTLKTRKCPRWFYVYNTHLALSKKERKKQAAYLFGVARFPAIIAGDFNDKNLLTSYDTIQHKVDYIIINSDDIRILEEEVIQTRGSDHLPILAKMEIVP
jgi:endonuclease/exonuclease/phosphatase family metal-dependent hydrolase